MELSLGVIRFVERDLCYLKVSALIKTVFSQTPKHHTPTRTEFDDVTAAFRVVALELTFAFGRKVAVESFGFVYMLLFVGDEGLERTLLSRGCRNVVEGL